MSEPTPRIPASDPKFVPNRATVSLPAIAHNARELHTLLGEHTALMAVVKADAYGHGLVETAQAALAGGATWLGVAHPSSALALARAGVDAPILSWVYEPVTAREIFPHVIGAGVDLAVSSMEQLSLVIEAAQKVERRARVHVKMDTGMGRSGVLPVDVARIGAEIRAHDSVQLVGAMSHFYDADTPGSPSVDRQAAVFDQMCAELEEEAGPIPIKHIANTAATLTRPDLHFDMVRPGIALYGFSNVPTELDLRPAMSLTTRVSVVKDVQPGQVVGYGATFTCEEATTLGLLPIGYADGLPRSSSNRARVLVRTEGGDELVSQVGRVSMDQIVVDLGVDTNAQPGDSVVIFGDPASISGVPTAHDLAEASDTISYEILTSVSARVPRVIEPIVKEEERTWTPSVPQPRTVTVSTRGADDTRRAARALAASARAGDLYVLDGPLGAGKTTFTQGFAGALNVRGNVASPTFVISRVHPSQVDGPDLVHVDAYRLDEDWDIEDLDLDSGIEESITLVEWGRDRVEHLSDSYAVVALRRDESVPLSDDPDDTDEARSLSVTFTGPRYSDDDIVRVLVDLRDAGFDVDAQEGKNA